MGRASRRKRDAMAGLRLPGGAHVVFEPVSPPVAGTWAGDTDSDGSVLTVGGTNYAWNALLRCYMWHEDRAGGDWHYLWIRPADTYVMSRCMAETVVAEPSQVGRWSAA